MRDYEHQPSSSACRVHWAMIDVMSRRLTRRQPHPPGVPRWWWAHDLEPLLARLTAHEQQAAADAEHLREQIAELTGRLREAEQELEHLRITRKTILSLPDEDTPRPPAPETPAPPEHPDYRRILATFAAADRPLRARDLCKAIRT